MSEMAKLASDLSLFVVALQEHRRREDLDVDVGNGWIFKGSAASDLGAGGIGYLLSPRAFECLLDIRFVTSRLACASFALDDRRLNVICVYAPTAPRTQADPTDTESLYAALSDCLSSLPARDLSVVVGDFNAPLVPDGTTVRNRCGLENSNSEYLRQLIISHDLISTNGCMRQRFQDLVTFSDPRGRRTRLDWLLIPLSHRRRLLKVESLTPKIVTSDHRLVSITLNARWPNISHPPPQPFWLELKQEEAQKKFLSQVKDSLAGDTSEVTSFARLQRAITSAAESLPRRRPQVKQPAIWDSDPVIEMARRELQSMREQHGTDAPQAADAYATFQNVYSERMEAQVKNVIDFVQHASENKRHMAAWKAINLLTGRKDRPRTVVAAASIEHRKQVVRAHYRRILNAEPPPISTPLIAPNNWCPSSSQQNFNCEAITVVEIALALRGTKADAASGPDNIPARVWKLPGMANMLSPIFNSASALGDNTTQHTPSEWRVSTIVSIPKKGNSTALDNQRGISLMATAAKLFNKVLLNRLLPVLNPMLLSLQSGFRPHRSTVEQIVALRTVIDDCKVHQRNVTIVFVDFQKAFDSVSRASIPQILLLYGVPTTLIQSVMGLYENTTAAVRTSHGLTDSFVTSSGVLQGDTLAPFIFVLRRALHDSDAYMLRMRRSSRHEALPLPALAYADDIAILSPDIPAAQRQINRLHDEANRVGLRISASKTEVLLIGSRSPTPPSPITLPTGEALKFCHDFRYLGVNILAPDSVLQERWALTWRAASRLRPLFFSTLSDELKIRLLKTIVEPVLTYGLECVPMTHTREEKNNGTFRRLLRYALGTKFPTIVTNAQLQQRTNLPSLSTILRRHRLRLIGNVLRSDAQAVSTNHPRDPIALVLSTPPTEKQRRGMANFYSLRSQMRDDLQQLKLSVTDVVSTSRTDFELKVLTVI
jgi:hypothetical protein